MDRKRVGQIATGCAALVLIAGQLGYKASAQDAGPEWQSRTAEQSKIVFVAPGLEDQRVRYLRTAAENHKYTLEVAYWRGAAAHHHKAQVQFVELSPSRHFRSSDRPQSFVEALSTFKDKDLEFEDIERNGNRLGTIQSQRFGFDDVECLGFAQYWGQSAGDFGSAGTNLLYGYYCADPGRSLSEETREAVITGLGVKGWAVPEVQRALPLAIWLERPGRTKGLYFGKLFFEKGAGEGDLQFRLPSPYGRCDGRWKLRGVAAASPAQAELDWQVDCANGLSAVGDYTIGESGRGAGEGKTTDDARISLEFDS